MYILGINGPPYAGKDTFATMMVQYVEAKGASVRPIKVDHLSQPLREMAYKMVGYHGGLIGPDYDLFKTTHFEQFSCTGRELMIDISEQFLKPTYGIGVLAQMLLQRNANFSGLLIVPDSGFQCEVGPLQEAIGVDNFYVVRLHREGHNFNNDSREWVYTPNDTDVSNDGSMDDLWTEVGRIYGRLVNQMAWKL